jgi:hypothetical protein
VDPTPAKNYINLRPGSNTSYSGYTLAPSACVDFYYEVQVTRNSNAYEDTRRYYITATADTLATISTPRPREIFVEHLISQNRNAVTDVKLNSVSIPAGGTMSLMVGNTCHSTGREHSHPGVRATRKFYQFSQHNLSGNLLHQLTQPLTITPDPLATTRPYADGCNWVNDPFANYRSCTETVWYIILSHNVTILAALAQPRH